MTQYIFYALIIFTSIGPIKSTNLINKLTDGNKIYICGSASSFSDAPPPKKNGVLVNVTDSNEESECVFNTFNHTIHRAKVVSIVGVDRFTNEKQFYSIGPIHQWPDMDTPNLTLNTMLKSTVCWNTRTKKFNSHTYVIMADPFNTFFDLLIGMNARSPVAEVHVAYFSPFPSLKTEFLEANIIKTESSLKQKPYYINYLPKMNVTCEDPAAVR